MKKVIKENDAFRLSLSKKLCVMPTDLFHVELIQECLTKGDVSSSSTYQFFMTQEEMNTLAEALTQ